MDTNNILSGLPKFIELEIAEAIRPLLDRLAELEKRIEHLEPQPEPKPGLLRRIWGTA